MPSLMSHPIDGPTLEELFSRFRINSGEEAFNELRLEFDDECDEQSFCFCCADSMDSILVQ